MIKINPSILSKTVKVITPKTEKVEEAQIRGTIVFRNNEQFVQLDGAPDSALTPITDVAEGASDAGFVHGDRVLVLLKNHQAIVTKNLTVGLQAQAAKEAGSFVTTITDEGITAQRIIANDTFTNTLRANHIRADDIIAGMATIDTLDSNYAHITEGVIDNAKIGVADVNDLSANYAHITEGVIDNAKIGVADVNDLSANYAHITQGVIDNAKIGVADVNDLSANYAHITQGVIDNAKIGVADVNDLSANYAHITQGVIDNATIDQANINNLAANYAKVNAANIDSAAIRNAWVDKIMVQTGLLAYSSQIYTLDAIEVNAANITAGTLDVNRLIVTVGEGSSAQKYLVNIDPSTGTPSYEKLDGNIVAPRTITADKIVAGAITTNEITANNLQGTSGWINLHEGKFFYGDGASFASATNAISWNGSKLQIKADEFLLSTGQTIQDSIESVENWFYSVPPTTSNPPASSWTTTNLKEQHLRDIYFDTTSGKSYRWAKEGSTYKWVEIEDVELAALAKDLHDNYPPRSEFTVAPDKIQSTVSAAQTAATNAANTATDNKLKSYETTANADKVRTRLSTAETNITQNAESIKLEASRREMAVNMLLDTDVPSLTKVNALYDRYWSDAGQASWCTPSIVELTDPPEQGIKYACRFVATASGHANNNNGRAIAFYSTQETGKVLPLKVGTKYTVSYWARCTSGQGRAWVRYSYKKNAAGTDNQGRAAVNITDLTSTWKRYTGTIELESETLYNRVWFYAYFPANTAGTVEICGIKLVAGDNVEAYSTTIEQTADNVLIKATRSGASAADKTAGGTSAIGLINVSPDNVKIAAKHVEIDGAAIFNNTDFQTNISGAYYKSTNITSSTTDKDINNYKTTGIYHCATTMTNAPVTNYGTLIVDWNVGTKYQEYYPDNLTYYYKRTWDNSTSAWRAWSEKIDAIGAQATADAKKSIHTLTSSYSQTYSTLLGWSTEGKNAGNWDVTSTTGVKKDDTVRIKCTVSDMTGTPAVYVVGTVTVVDSATRLHMISHGLDTTVIDGGNILTNSIGANQIASNAITVGKMDSTTQSQVLNSNIELGGTNILRGTANPLTRSSYWHYFGWYQSGADGTLEYNVRLPSSPIPEITNGAKITVNKAGSYVGIAQGSVPFHKGTVTLSAWVKGTAGDIVRLQPLWSYADSTTPEGGAKDFTVADSNWHKYEYTHAVNYDHPSGPTSASSSNNYANAGYVQYRSATTGRVAYVCGIKLEYGNKSTEWSASPDDFVDDADNMLLDWDVNSLTRVKASHDRYWSDAGNTWITPSFQNLLDPPEAGIKYMQQYVVSTANSSAGSRQLAFYSENGYTALPLKLNTPYTVSCWARCTSGSGQLRIVGQGMGSVTNTGGTFALTSDWKRYSNTYIITATPSSYYRVWIGSYFPANTTGTVEVCGCKLVAGTDGDQAAKTATGYITDIDSKKGITIKPSDSTGNDYLQINSTAIDFYRNNVSMVNMNDTDIRVGKLADDHVRINSSGMTVYAGDENTASNNVAFFGADSRIGNASGRRVQTYAGGIQVYNENNELRSQFGSNWILLGKSNGTRITMGTATNPYVYMNADGVQCLNANADGVDVGNPSAGHAFLKSDGLHVYNGSGTDANEVAFFGTSARVGKTSSNNIVIDSDSFEVNDADDFTQFSITPSSTATSHTSDRSLGVNIASGTTRKKTLPKNITSFRITVYPSSGSASTATISIPATTAGATQSKTVGVATVTLTRLTANGPVELSVKANSQIKTARFWYTSPRRVANITAGGYDLCYTAGDYISYYEWTGASFLTNSKQKIDVVLPINKPILAESVTVSSVELTTRQSGNYTHGSSASGSVSWTVDSATLMEGGIRLVLSRTTTTNAVNNDAIGINLTCNITFS